MKGFGVVYVALVRRLWHLANSSQNQPAAYGKRQAQAKFSATAPGSCLEYPRLKAFEHLQLAMNHHQVLAFGGSRSFSMC